MKKMDASNPAIKALFDNPEFLTKFASLVEEQVSKTKVTNEVIEDDSKNTKNKIKQPLKSTSKRAYKRRKITDTSPTKKNDSIDNVKCLLQDEDIKKKIAPYISECIQSNDKSDNSSDEKVSDNAQTNTNTVNVLQIEAKPLENVPLDKDINSDVNNDVNDVDKKSFSGDTNQETENDFLEQDETKVDSTQIVNNETFENNTTVEQSTETNLRDDEENNDVSQSDDFYYLSMANSTDTPAVPPVPETTPPSPITVTSKMLSANNSVAAIEPNKLNPKVKNIVFKPVIKIHNNQKLKLGEVVTKKVIIPNSKFNKINSNSVQRFSTISTQDGFYKKIIVIADNKEKSIESSPKNISKPKPVIKSNERVKLQGKVLTKIGNDINNIIVSDVSGSIAKSVVPIDSFKLPKIESVMSYAESLPKITSVTSCATSDIENVVTQTPSLDCDLDMVSLAERISPISVNHTPKILKIKEQVIKGKIKKNLDKKIVEQVKEISSVIEKKNDSVISSHKSIDNTIEEVIAQAVREIDYTSSIVSSEKISQESEIVDVNGLNRETFPKNVLNVLKPAMEYGNNGIQSDTDNVSFVIEEPADRSGLPSIKDVVSLAKDHVLDDCLEEANQKLLSTNGLFATDTTEDKQDDQFKEPSELYDSMDLGMQSGNDDFNFAVDSLIEDISKEKSSKRSTIRHKPTPLSTRKQFAPSNIRTKQLKVLKPVVQKGKRGRRKGVFRGRTVQAVENSIKKHTAVDSMEIDFAELNLINGNSTLLENKSNDASVDQSTPIEMDISQTTHSPKKSPTKLPAKSPEKQTEANTSNVTEQPDPVDSHIPEQSDNSQDAVENTLDDSTRGTEEYEELLEEVPLQQRRCNNFYVKVPTGEELGTNINLEEYEKFFSIQDEKHPNKIRKTEIESLPNDEDLPGTPGKRRSKCSHCDRTFVDPSIRDIHEATCENDDPKSSECSKCGRWFARMSYRKVHEKKCQKVYGTVEVPTEPLNDVLRCVMCPFSTGHKTAYINHLKSHMHSHTKTTSMSARTAALRRKFGYRRKKRKLRYSVLKNRCEICSDDAGGVEHMVSRCRRCGAFNVQWCDECNKGGYSTACRLKHHEAVCTSTPHTRCNDVPRVRLERIGPPLPLHCVSCDVTRILYVREKRCKECSTQLLFKCEMCAELRDTFAELCGHVARAHIIGCLVQCDDCGKNCEDLALHRRVCEYPTKDTEVRNEIEEQKKIDLSPETPVNDQSIHFSEDDECNEKSTTISLDDLILELDEDSNEENSNDEDQPMRVEEV